MLVDLERPGAAEHHHAAEHVPVRFRKACWSSAGRYRTIPPKTPPPTTTLEPHDAVDRVAEDRVEGADQRGKEDEIDRHDPDAPVQFVDHAGDRESWLHDSSSHSLLACRPAFPRRLGYGVDQAMPPESAAVNNRAGDFQDCERGERSRRRAGQAKVSGIRRSWSRRRPSGRSTSSATSRANIPRRAIRAGNSRTRALRPCRTGGARCGARRRVVAADGRDEEDLQPEDQAGAEADIAVVEARP